MNKLFDKTERRVVVSKNTQKQALAPDTFGA